jgi:hypothetical protein
MAASARMLFVGMVNIRRLNLLVSAWRQGSSAGAEAR